MCEKSTYVKACYAHQPRRPSRASQKLNSPCVDVLVQAPYFYEVGNKLNEMWEKSPIFSDFLVRTFRTRYYELISKVRCT